MSQNTFEKSNLNGQSIQFSTTRQLSKKKEWTIMVYFAGDNNLSENMAFSIESLGQFSASLSDEERSQINLLAYFDGASMTAPTLYLDYSEAKADGKPFRQPVTPALQIHRPNENAERPQTPLEFAGPVSEDSGSSEAILNFVRWCTASEDENGRGRKARNYALILSGHSLGFHGKTFLCDESSGKHFTLSGFRRTLEQANDLYLSDSQDGRIALLGFDSCLMSMLEVGYELKDVAAAIVASQGALPNSGWSYAPMLSEFVSTLSKNESNDSETRVAPEDRSKTSKSRVHDGARSLVRSFTEFHKDLAIGGRSIDISAWDLDRVGPLTEAVNRLGAKLNHLLTVSSDSGTGKPSPLFHELKKIILQSHYDSQTYMEDQCVDIKDFCQRMGMECDMIASRPFGPEMRTISGLCNDVIAEVDNCVLACGFSGDNYQFSTGISMFFPWSIVAFSLTDLRYRMTRFVRGKGNRDIRRPLGPGREWYAFLQNYIGNVTLRRSRTAPKVSDAHTMFYDKIAPSPGLSYELLSKNCMPYMRNCMPYMRGGVSSYNNFGQFKNFEMGWDISGFAEDLPNWSSDKE